MLIKDKKVSETALVRKGKFPFSSFTWRCSQGCRSDTSLTRRLKREVTTSKEDFRPTTTQSYKINQGPIQIIDKKGELKGNQSINQYLLQKKDVGTEFGFLQTWIFCPHRNTLMHSIHMLTKHICMLMKFNVRFTNSINRLHVTLAWIFSTLTSSKKNSFIFHADTGNTGKQAAVIFGASAAGGVGLLFLVGGVAFVVVKFRLVRLLMKKPNQVRDLYATQDEPTSW